MEFDPSIEARRAFEQVCDSDELGDALEAAMEAQERFSNSAGKEATEAYEELLAIGERHPEAHTFGEFLVYATWSHLMEAPYPVHFRRGLTLCQSLLQRNAVHQNSKGDAERLKRLQAMAESFQGGLGEESEDLMDYDADNLKCGD